MDQTSRGESSESSIVCPATENSEPRTPVEQQLYFVELRKQVKKLARKTPSSQGRGGIHPDSPFVNLASPVMGESLPGQVETWNQQPFSSDKAATDDHEHHAQMHSTQLRK
jgi:hypothetical protein